MKDEGYIKYECNWQNKALLTQSDIIEINQYRKNLFHLKLIGVFADGIGYGNISQRYKIDQFIISGSATGGINNLTADHYALVTHFDIEANKLFCSGRVKASSEALTHAALYKADQHIGAVIHVHSQILWKSFINKRMTSSADAAYGTPAMAMEIYQLALNRSPKYEPLIIMGGHQDGIIAFGNSLEAAEQTLLRHLV